MKKRIALLVSLFVLVILLRACLLPVTVNGSSMMNTLEDSNFVLMSRDFSEIRRFDIVVLNSKELDQKIIKRIVGLPGETIEYKNDKLYVNEKYVKESFLDKSFMRKMKKQMKVDFFTNNFKVTLGKDEYYVLGDNRVNSTDSRMLGSFSKKDIRGKGGMLLFPFNRIRRID